MGEKVGFTNCVFKKLCCFSENTIFIVLSAKHSFSKAKTVCCKKTENLWKIVGCFWTWQNGVVWVCFIGFNVIVVCFWCAWHSSRSVKNACVAQFFGLLWGGLFLFIFGFGRFRCFLFLVFVSVVCVALVSVLFALFCFVVGLFLVLVLVLLLFLFFLFFFCFLFLFFLFLFFLFWLFFRWGGPKGHLTWP